MRRVRVLIVDDEFFVCQLIYHLMDWEKYHAEVVGMIDNGEEALDMILKECPDIIISDIRMPGLNGIELVQAVKNLKKPAKIILISGHRSFEYAKEAINLGADYYLLKPIRKNELQEVFSSIVNEIEKERKAMDVEREYRKKLLLNKRELRNQFINFLVSGKLKGERDIDSVNKKYQFSFRKGKFQLAMLKLDFEETDQHQRPETKILKQQLSKYNYELDKYCWDFEMLIDENAIYVLMNFSEKQGIYIAQRLKIVRETMQDISKCLVTLILGREWNTLFEMEKNMPQFRKAVYERIKTQDKIIAEDQIGEYRQEHTTAKVGKLIRCIEAGNYEGINEYLENEQKEMIKESGENQIRKIQQIVGTFYQLFEDGKYQEKGHCIQENVENLNSIYKIWKYVKKMIEEAIQENKEHFRNVNSIQVKETIAYIKLHYSENLKLTEMAERVYISPQYLSSLFKKEMDMTISEYIALLRIEKAKELLRGSSHNVAEIAERIGYRDIRHFSMVFKRITGLTPTEYRKIGI